MVLGDLPPRALQRMARHPAPHQATSDPSHQHPTRVTGIAWLRAVAGWLAALARDLDQLARPKIGDGDQLAMQFLSLPLELMKVIGRHHVGVLRIL